MKFNPMHSKNRRVIGLFLLSFQRLLLHSAQHELIVGLLSRPSVEPMPWWCTWIPNDPRFGRAFRVAVQMLPCLSR
jgi:hypothetical protein